MTPVPINVTQEENPRGLLVELGTLTMHKGWYPHDKAWQEQFFRLCGFPEHPSKPVSRPEFAERERMPSYNGLEVRNDCMGGSQSRYYH